MSEHSLIVSFQDQSESYVNGFEAGQIYEKLQRMEPIQDYTVHTNNLSTLARIAQQFGQAMDVEETDVAGWSVITCRRGKPKLSVVVSPRRSNET